MKVYLAGPMSHHPQMNFPAFDAAAESLRKDGHEVISPAELDSPEAREAALSSTDGDPAGYAEGDTWGNLLARDIELIADDGIEAIVVLPGWANSRGARLETFVGRLCGLPIIRYPDLNAVEPHEIHLAHSVSEVRCVDPETGGEKGEKPEQFSLLPWEQLGEVARLYHFGAQKYERHNWRRGYEWHCSYDALFRHAAESVEGREVDEETGCDPLASVIFHALTLMYFKRHHRQKDDRA